MATVAIAGAGWAGSVHAAAAASTGRARVRAIASRDRGRAERLAGSAGADAVTYAELNGREDLTVVATPPTHHHELATRLLGSGATVLIEKPLCSTLAEADDLIDAATASGAVAGLAENLLFAPVVVDALARIAGLGSLRHVGIRCCQPAPDWGHFVEPLTAGGVLFDLGAHPVALALAMASHAGAGSAINAVSAELTSTRGDGADDHATARLELEAGPTIDIECSWTAPEPTWSLQAASDTGTVVCELQPRISLEADGEPIDTGDHSAETALVDYGYVAQLNGILDVAAGRGGNVCPLGFGRQVLEVTVAAYASAGRGGAQVALPWTGRRDITPMQAWRPSPRDLAPT